MSSVIVRNDCKLALPGWGNKELNGTLIVAGDVGGTKTNLALFRIGETLEELYADSFPSAEYTSLLQLLQDFFKDLPGKPSRICLGVAGPVINGSADLTNLGWDVHISELVEALGVEHIQLINDLEATAFGMAALGPDDLVTLQEGHHLNGNCAIVAPGTGLGEAGLFWNGEALFPFPTEGGHCDFSPRSDLDYKLFKYLENLYGIVSWEKLISGPAIEDIFNFLTRERACQVPQRLKEAFQQEDPSAVISKEAIAKGDPVCMETMELFVVYMGRECSNMVLKMKALGGLYLSGGIPPKILPLLQQPVFIDSYMKSDRMEHLLEQVGIHVIMNQEAPMLGAACYAAYGKW